MPRKGKYIPLAKMSQGRPVRPIFKREVLSGVAHITVSSQIKSKNKAILPAAGSARMTIAKTAQVKSKSEHIESLKKAAAADQYNPLAVEKHPLQAI